MVYYETNELYHHGILGQKWGKKNGPPYPLKVSKHSASEKKAGWRQSLDSSKENSYNQKNQFRLSAKYKKAIVIGIGAAIAVGTVIYLSNNGHFSDMAKVGERFASKQMETFSGMKVDDLKFNPKDFVSDDFLSPAEDIAGLPKISEFPSKISSQFLIDDLRNVNQLHGRSNCVACTVTEYFRSRGYDVTSKSRDGNQFNKEFLLNEVGLLFPGFDEQFHNVPINLNLMQSADKVRSEILKCGEGSSGIFAVNYSREHISFMKSLYPNFQDTGHAISWRVINGKVLFMDGQNAMYGDGMFEHLIGTADTNKVFFGRFDNLEIDPTFIPIFMNPAKNI